MAKLMISLTRWTARVASLLVAGAYVMFVLGEFFPHPHSGPPTRFREWAGIVLLTLTIIAMLVAWKWELAGALVSLAALGAFVLVVRMHVRMHNYVVTGVVAIPGLLFAADWVLRRLFLAATHGHENV